MHIETDIVIIALGCAVVCVAVLKGMSSYRKNIFLKRKNMSLGYIYSEYFEGREIDRECFCSEWNRVSETFNVNPEKLRPTDSFNGIFRDLDSWNLGDGIEVLERRMYDLERNDRKAGLICETLDDYIVYCCRKVRQ